MIWVTRGAEADSEVNLTANSFADDQMSSAELRQIKHLV